MFIKCFSYFTLKYLGYGLSCSCCCIRYASFSPNGLFIAITSLLKLIFLILGCILILYLNFYCTNYIFYFTITSLTNDSNDVWNNSQYSTCKHLNLHNSIISKFLSYLHLVLLQHGDIESNPGPDKIKLKNFSFCHWNVNSLVAHTFLKLHQLEAYNLLYNYDIKCISETYLDSSLTHNNENIQLERYSLIRSDHPSDSKRGGVWLHYKESLGVKIINVSARNECILCEVFIENCKGFIAVIYRSPSQNNDQFEQILSSFEDLINEITPSNPFFYLILGDFNARSPTWWDDDKISIEGTRLDGLSSFHGLHQLIKEPTHLMENSASCIDLIFTNQSNLVIDPGVHPSSNSVIPDIQSCKTNSRLSWLSFENDDILKLIRSLNIQKAHCLDDISIRMIKICDSALVKPLLLIF